MMDSPQATATLVKSYVSEDRVDRPPLAQSREIGGAVPIGRPEGAQALNFAKSWSHFVAGGYVWSNTVHRVLGTRRSASEV